MFKRKKKNEGLEEKVNVKKGTIILIEVIVAVILLASFIGIKYLISNKQNDNVIRISDQTVDGITFSDFTITYEDEVSKISVNLINETEEDIKLGTLYIKLYASDNTQMSEVQLPYNITLEPNQSIEAENNVEMDLTDITQVEYSIK